MGHETGHYVLGHIWKGILFLSVMLFIAFYIFGYRIAKAAISLWANDWVFEGRADWASLSFTVADRARTGIPRHTDRKYLLAATGSTRLTSTDWKSSTALCQTAPGSVPKTRGEELLLIHTRTSSLVFWAYNHPSIADRLLFSLAYRPWGRRKADSVCEILEVTGAGYHRHKEIALCDHRKQWHC